MNKQEFIKKWGGYGSPAEVEFTKDLDSLLSPQIGGEVIHDIFLEARAKCGTEQGYNRCGTFVYTNWDDFKAHHPALFQKSVSKENLTTEITQSNLSELERQNLFLSG